MVIYYVVIYNTDINIAGNICAAGVTKQPLQSSRYKAAVIAEPNLIFGARFLRH